MALLRFPTHCFQYDVMFFVVKINTKDGIALIFFFFWYLHENKIVHGYVMLLILCSCKCSVEIFFQNIEIGPSDFVVYRYDTIFEMVY